LEHALFDKRLQAFDLAPKARIRHPNFLKNCVLGPFDLAPKARIRHPNFLKNCVLGPSGPKIKAKAVQETAGSSSRGAGCA